MDNDNKKEESKDVKEEKEVNDKENIDKELEEYENMILQYKKIKYSKFL